MNNSGLDINILEAYLKGTLDPKLMHQVEKKALEDPFVAEALEGLSQSAAYTQNLSLLQKQLHERVAEQKMGKKAKVITWQRLSIAAAASVVFISVGILFFMKGSNTTEQHAKSKGVEVNLTPLESDSVPVLASTALPKRKAEAAKSVVTAPARKVAVPKKVEEEISAAIAEAAPTALARNTVKPQQKEEIILRSAAAKKAPSSVEPAMAVTALQSRVEDISLPVAKGKAVSPRDGTPVPDPIERPVLGNKPETLAYSKDVKSISSHSLTLSALNGNNQELNEVVVSGLSRFAPAKPGPVPSIDQAAYTSYLNRNNRWHTGNTPGQYVELSFSVSKTGKPENIQVIKGLELRYNEEAIRLLADGPKWIVPRKGSNKATLKVYF